MAGWGGGDYPLIDRALSVSQAVSKGGSGIDSTRDYLLFDSLLEKRPPVPCSEMLKGDCRLCLHVFLSCFLWCLSVECSSETCVALYTGTFQTHYMH